MPNYFAFGLGIRSEFELYESAAGGSKQDITIHRGAVPCDLAPPSKMVTWPVLNSEEAVLNLGAAGRIGVYHGSEIVVDMEPGADPGMIRMALSGGVMGVTLTQRGKLVLHASCIQLGKSAVAFMGDSGWGKSSIAAALISRGHRLISDDMAVLDLEEDHACVYPGYPMLKISADVAKNLGIDFDSLPKMYEGEAKRALCLNTSASADPIPFRRVYVLGLDKELGIMPFHDALGLFNIIANSYPTQLPKDRDRTTFIRCGELLKRVQVFHLLRTRDLKNLGELAELVEADCAS